MRILLLTSTLGSGHYRASEAIKHALLERYPGTKIRQIDFWGLMDQGVASAVKEAYLEFVTHHPDLYDNLYGRDRHTLLQLLVAGSIPDQVVSLVQGLRSHQVMGATRWLSPYHNLLDRALFTFFLASLAGPHHFQAGRTFRRAVLTWIPLRLAKRLRAEVLRFSPDSVVATQMLPAALMSCLGGWRSMGASVVVAVLTDYGVHDLWVQQRTDHYCVPTEDVAMDLRTRGVQAHRIHITGIPLMPSFRRPPSCTQAREKLRLDPVRPTLLVVGGGLGIGIYRVVVNLVRHEPSWQVLVAAGRNGATVELLSPLVAEAPTQVRLFGWTDSMEILMRAADVVVAKPGGLTLAEALACGRPLVAYDSLGGQEGFNTRFLVRYGVGGPVAESQLAERLQSLLGDRRELTCLQDRARSLGRRDAAEQVAALVCELVSSGTRDRDENIFHSTSHQVGVQPV